ncbi:MAG: hypothetical protein IPM76_23240 [Chloroflexi bacterium]|nr:hypothetical protein [Chloroflexota bacterium]
MKDFIASLFLIVIAGPTAAMLLVSRADRHRASSEAGGVSLCGPPGAGLPRRPTHRDADTDATRRLARRPATAPITLPP